MGWKKNNTETWEARKIFVPIFYTPVRSGIPMPTTGSACQERGSLVPWRSQLMACHPRQERGSRHRPSLTRSGTVTGAFPADGLCARHPSFQDRRRADCGQIHRVLPLARWQWHLAMTRVADPEGANAPTTGDPGPNNASQKLMATVGIRRPEG